MHAGEAYSGGDIIEVNLDPLQTLHFQDTNFTDISGALIMANKPVAVFSGNWLTGE